MLKNSLHSARDWARGTKKINSYLEKAPGKWTMAHSSMKSFFKWCSRSNEITCISCDRSPVGCLNYQLKQLARCLTYKSHICANVQDEELQVAICYWSSRFRFIMIWIFLGGIRQLPGIWSVLFFLFFGKVSEQFRNTQISKTIKLKET